MLFINVRKYNAALLDACSNSRLGLKVIDDDVNSNDDDIHKNDFDSSEINKDPHEKLTSRITCPCVTLRLPQGCIADYGLHSNKPTREVRPCRCLPLPASNFKNKTINP